VALVSSSTSIIARREVGLRLAALTLTADDYHERAKLEPSDSRRAATEFEAQLDFPVRETEADEDTAATVCSGRDLHSGRLCEVLQRIAGDAEDPPRVHLLRAELLVEADRRLVPVEDRPLEPPAAALDGERREMLQQRLAIAATAILGRDEEILEVEAGLAEKRRVVLKEEREAGRLVPA